MTGQFCWRSRLKSGVLNAWDEPLVPPERPAVASLLRDHGYATGCFGKWHLGLSWPFVGRIPPGFDLTVTSSAIDWSRRIGGGPVDHGFDYFFGINIPNEPPYTFIQNDHVLSMPTVQFETVRGLQSHWAGPGVPGWDWSAVLPTVVSNAGAWLQRQIVQVPKRPFFLYLALPGPHQPIVPTAQFLGTSQAGIYGDYVQELDWAVGQLLDRLEASGAAANTLVIFTSDNGPDEFTYERLRQYGHCSMGPWRGIKNDLWEGGHRVPFIARWPGKISGGSTSKQLICHVDFMRTVADILRVQLPARAAEDSISFLPALVGSGTSSARSSLVLESGPGQFGFCTNDWIFINSFTGDGHDPELEPLWFKLSRGYSLTNSHPALLYNLAVDPAESTNVYSAQFGLAARLEGVLGKQRAAQTWRGARSGYWTDFANWSQTNSPTECDLVLTNSPGCANFTQTLGTNFSINTLCVDAVTQQVTVSPGGPFALTIFNGINMSLAGSDLDLETPVRLAQSQSWEVGSNHTLVVRGPVSLANCELMICGAGNVMFTNTISGSGRLLVRSSGSVFVTGSNTFTGGLELSGGGLLVAQNALALGLGPVEIPNNSTLQIEPGVTLTNPLTLTGYGSSPRNVIRGAITMWRPGIANLDGQVTLSAETGICAHQVDCILTLGGPIAGEASLRILPGAGTVVLAATNLYSGATFIQGRLDLTGGPPDRLPATTQLFLENSGLASLNLNGINQTAALLSGGGPAGGRVALGTGTLVLNQAATCTYGGSLVGPGNLVKTNSGTIYLTGASSYTGTTTVSGGALVVNGALRNSSLSVVGATLGGTGTITGPVTIKAGGMFSPGLGLGTLTLGNSLTLADGSATLIEIDTVQNLSTHVQGATHITYGGTLSVKNLAGWETLSPGQHFRIFRASNSTGQFAAIRPAPGPNLAWYFTPADGTLTVIEQPTLRVTYADARHLRLSWSNPAFHLQAKTNSLSEELATNWFDYPVTTGPVIVPIDPGNRALFLRLVSP
jgi:autotransporter-associated beta strand protein